MTTVYNVLFSDDVLYMKKALCELGVPVEIDVAGGQARIHGLSGCIPRRNAELYLGNAATALRLLLSYVALGYGTFLLNGDARMQERPVQDLVDALLALGVQVEYLGNPGCPPVRVYGCGVGGGAVRVNGELSSQYVSSLLLSGPYFSSGLSLTLQGKLASKPYVALTVQVMQDFSVSCRQDQEYFFVAPGLYKAREYCVEGDFSNALYFLAVAALCGGMVRVYGLNPSSMQGDIAFLDVLTMMGCRIELGEDYVQLSGKLLYAVNVDLHDMPDCVPLLAVLALFAQGETVIRNVVQLRLKESDRLNALASELAKIGASVAQGADSLSVSPVKQYRAAELLTYNDHRLVMAFSLLALRVVGLRVLDVEAVSKSFPGFFDALDSLLCG